MKEKLLLAYSGGLDTSVICAWLNEKGYDVICFIADIGQREDFPALEEKAMKSGASKVVVVDCQDDFVERYVQPAIGFNALYEGRYLLGTSLARPALAHAMVREARRMGITCFAHGATGKGNDQVRFELAFHALMPRAKVIAPWRDAEFYRKIKGRKEAIAYANEHDIPIKATSEKPWSSDENLFHISYESGILEDPLTPPPKELFELTKDPLDAPDKPTELEITFTAGVATKLNNELLSPKEMLIRLNELGGANGVGRVDIVESRYVGMKSRGVYETPGGEILFAAHRDAESITLSSGVLALKETLMLRFAQLVYNGYWFCREMDCLLAFLKESQKSVNANVRLQLYKGNVTVLGRESQHSLYAEDLASMEDDGGAYTPEDAEGFIKLNALPLIAEAKQNKALKS